MSTAISTAARDSAPLIASDAPVREWVDALAAGTCTNVEFLRNFRERAEGDSEVLWEALSLLDQNFRTRKIDRDRYFSLKSNLERIALVRGDGLSLQVKAGSSTVVPDKSDSDRATSAAKSSASTAAVSKSGTVPVRVGAKLRDRYRIIGVLGSGAAGTVVEAIDEMRADVPDISQRLAIRIRNTRELEDAGQLAAYLRHVCKIQAFNHPNLTRIFDFDQDQGRLLLTMELLSGSKLPQLMARSGGPLSYVLDRQRIVQCVASAVQYAHAQGVAHGQLRADEILITNQGDVRVLGLECAYGSAADGFAKDHRSFASLVYDFLSENSQSDLLQRPAGLTDGQWQALSAVLAGNDAEGPDLLQQFAVATAPPVPQSTTTDNAAVARGDRKQILRGVLWGSLAMLGLLGTLYWVFNLTPSRPATQATVEPRVTAPTLKVPSAPQAAGGPVVSAAIAGVAVTPAISAVQPSATAVTSTVPAGARISTINLQQEAIEVVDNQTVVRIKVQRRGATWKVATFMWWTENGSAQPGVDFYAISPRAAEFPAGAATVDLLVPLVTNAASQQLRTFYVKIDEAGEGAALGERTLAHVSIIPPGYVPPPIDAAAPENDSPAPAATGSSESAAQPIGATNL